MRQSLHTLVAACATLALAAIAGAEGLTLKQIAELRGVGDAVVSPSGDMIAYTLNVQRELAEEDDGSTWTELHLIDERGESRPFITGHVDVGSIGWTPDGGAVTFLAKREGDEHRRLYAIPVAGGEARPIATLENSISSYTFSPDGDAVALLAFEPEDAEREKEKELGFDQYVFEEEWQPRRLYIHDLEDEDAEPRMLGLEGSVQAASWSPAGDRLAVTVTPRQLVDDTLMFKRIRIVSPGGEVLGRIDNPGKLGDFEWSPDGEFLAYIATETIHDTREGRLMVSGKNGGRHESPACRAARARAGRRLARRRHRSSSSATRAWSPGSGRSARRRRRAHHPAARRADLGRVHRVESGDIALLASTPEHPTEVYRLGAGESEAERLTNSNPWLATSSSRARRS